MNSGLITISYKHNFLKLVVNICFAFTVITGEIREDRRGDASHCSLPQPLACWTAFVGTQKSCCGYCSLRSYRSDQSFKGFRSALYLICLCILPSEPGHSFWVGGDATLGHWWGGDGFLLWIRQSREETSLGQDFHSIRECAHTCADVWLVSQGFLNCVYAFIYSLGWNLLFK